MAKMGKYCKAYSVRKLAEFSGWTVNTDQLRPEKRSVDEEKRSVDEKEGEAVRDEADSTYFYLQENFTVTDGVFIDENVVFDQVTDDWVAFCRGTLKFEVPSFAQAATGDPLQQSLEAAG